MFYGYCWHEGYLLPDFHKESLKKGLFMRFNLNPSLLTVLFLFACESKDTTTVSSSGPYGYDLIRDVMVPMRDNVKLATDIYFPTNNGQKLSQKLPTIMMRTPYNKARTDSPDQSAVYWASHGYVAMYQDTRGRYNSEGIWHMLDDDGVDGYDAAEWLVSQDWSNGKFGMYGTSYVGGTQHAMALEQAPGLTTIIPVDAMSNLGYYSMRYDGAYELRFWNWIHWAGQSGGRQSRDPGTKAMLSDFIEIENRRKYLHLFPVRRGTTPLKFMPEYEDWLVSAMKEGGNSDFWKQNNVRDYTDKYKDIPVYLVGGWYDSWGVNTTENYMALNKSIKGPVYLIMGPWIHGRQGEFTHGQVSFGAEAAIPDPMAWRIQWYNKWIKGEETSVGKDDPFKTKVRIFVMGSGDGSMSADSLLIHGGFWRNENEWPLARAENTPYYFHTGGIVKAVKPSENLASTDFFADPEDPVPSIGGNTSSGGGILLQGAWDQKGGDHVWNWKLPIPLSARNDVVVFQTEPLEEDVEVTGEIRVKLWASSLAKDTDFTAKLIDVYPASPDFPGGFDLNIGDGITRARFRNSRTEEKLMEPGEVYEFEIRLYPSSNIFKKGHRIRVDIAGSNFPRFDVNPNTGEPLNENRLKIKAVNTIYHDSRRPSHILLPIIPSGT